MDRWIKNPALAKAANILLRAFFHLWVQNALI